MMRKLNLIFMLFIVSLISIGFSSWVIIGENNNTHLLDEKINVGQNIEKDAPYVDLKAKKVVNKKEILDMYESRNLMMSLGTIESLDWTFSWKNKGTSETYSSLDLTTYFDIYDNNNPLCDDSPHLYNYDMKEYQYIDYHLLDTTQNQITSSIFYSPVYNSILDDTTSRDWSQIEIVYNEANDASVATSQKAEWDSEIKTFYPSNNAYRLDVKRLIRENKYYYYRFYFFYFEKPTSQDYKTIVYSNLTSFSQAISDATWPTITILEDKKTIAKDKTTYFRIPVSFVYKNTAGASQTITINNFQSTLIAKTTTNATNSNNKSIYKMVDLDMPFNSYATITAKDSSGITWSGVYSYFKVQEKTPMKQTKTNITTPLGFKYDSTVLKQVDQITLPTFTFVFKNPITNEILEKPYNENTGIRPRSYLSKIFNRIHKDTITFDYIIRLNIKDEYKGHINEILDAFEFDTQCQFNIV